LDVISQIRLQLCKDRILLHHAEWSNFRKDSGRAHEAWDLLNCLARMSVQRFAAEKLLIDELTFSEEGDRWTFDRIPQMPLLGFLTGSVLSLGIWLAAALIVLKLVA